MSKDEITLFDLASKGDTNRCWTPNPWKTRLALNYKGIPYKTVWLEYPEIRKTLEPTGLPPNPEGANSEYSVPVIKLPDNDPEYIMDSRNIIDVLEKRHPEPSVHLDSPIVKKVEELIGSGLRPMVFVLLPKVPRSLLNEESQEYYYSAREKRFGAPLLELEKKKGGEEAWQAAKEPLMQVAAMLKEHGGPFFMGETFSYADCYLAGYLQFMRRLDEGGDHGLFERVCGHDEAYRKFYEACKPYLARDDH